MARAKARGWDRGVVARATLGLTPGVAQDKAPRSQVDAWPRDLTGWEQSLPWVHRHFSLSARHGQGAGLPAAHVGACSKAVNSGLRRLIPRRVIAAPPVGRRPSAGAAGRPASAIGPAAMANNGGGSSSAATASAVGNDWRRAGAVHLRTGPSRARASAQRQPTRILRPGRAQGPGVMTCLLSGMNSHSNVFARCCAAWRYVACWIARHAIDSAAGAGAGSD